MYEWYSQWSNCIYLLLNTSDNWHSLCKWRFERLIVGLQKISVAGAMWVSQVFYVLDLGRPRQTKMTRFIRFFADLSENRSRWTLKAIQIHTCIPIQFSKYLRQRFSMILDEFGQFCLVWDIGLKAKNGWWWTPARATLRKPASRWIINFYVIALGQWYDNLMRDLTGTEWSTWGIPPMTPTSVTDQTWQNRPEQLKIWNPISKWVQWTRSG